jgi:hypothetical protein
MAFLVTQGDTDLPGDRQGTTEVPQRFLLRGTQW